MNSGVGGRNWFEVEEVAAIPSPSLLVYRQRVEQNVRQMLAIAGNPARLRPHIKTHKMREVIDLQRAHGITKFKCATIAEAELAALAGVQDLLLAYQPVGPAVRRVAELLLRFPDVHFSVIADNAAVPVELSQSIRSLVVPNSGLEAPVLDIFIDLDVGQHRTGIMPGNQALELYGFIASLPGLKPVGLHAYDGHLTDSDPSRRAAACEESFSLVKALRDQLCQAGFALPRVVAGGTPTFTFHAKRGDVECSPGTCVFWDAGYSSKLRDLDFLHAALVLTRVISKPGARRLCLDLGHKAIASEMPPPRVELLGLKDASFVAHSEEHLVVETNHSSDFEIGDCLCGVPWHVCPTVALHSEAIVIENGKPGGSWAVVARDRRLTI
jgi:D-serine deaminase-like pyridoxal phosphate-dependent protein